MTFFWYYIAGSAEIDDKGVSYNSLDSVLGSIHDIMVVFF